MTRIAKWLWLALLNILLQATAQGFLPTSTPRSSKNHHQSAIGSISLASISMDLEELSEHLGGTGRARLVWDLYRLGVDPLDYYYGQSERPSQIDKIQQLLPTSRRGRTLGRATLQKLERIQDGVATLNQSVTSLDQTTKLLLALKDGLEIETVIIPWPEKQSSTICISSQVGCLQGCQFCATGKMGKLRSLTTDEIMAQMFFAQQVCRQQQLPSIQNVVFMGMGDSGDEDVAPSVVQATKLFTARGLFQLSATKVTVSTVAPHPSAFAQFVDAPCILAWSVHAVDDALRKRLVPTTRYPMTELRQGLIDERPMPLRTTMLEYALMADINDSSEQADDLARFAQGIIDAVDGCKLMINIIPYNDTGSKVFRKPSKEKEIAFQQRLIKKHGLYAFVRQTRGDDESAACGQLATKSKEKGENSTKEEIVA